MLEFKVDARAIVPIATAFEEAGRKAPQAIARTLNWVGDVARTQVTRTLAAETGVSYGTVRKQLRVKRARATDLNYDIGVSGAHIPLAEFKARQAKLGVSAAPWGQRRVFAHTFIVPKLGGQVFVREGKGRFPIRKLWGPSLPVELLRGKAPEAFQRVAEQALPARMQHELDRLFTITAPSASGTRR